MSILNPHFGHVDAAAYKVPDLIRRLGDVSFDEVLSKDRLDMVDAIAQHSNSTNELILDGLHSIGKLLVSIAISDDQEVEKSDLGNLGALIKHLAYEADFMRFTHNEMRHILGQQAAKGKA